MTRYLFIAAVLVLGTAACVPVQPVYYDEDSAAAPPVIYLSQPSSLPPPAMLMAPVRPGYAAPGMAPL